MRVSECRATSDTWGQHPMSTETVTEVAVLSDRADLELFISTWLPGYTAQRIDDLDDAVAITRRGGVVLIDMASNRHEAWLTALLKRGFDGPMVFLNPEGDMTIDLTERVVVTSPPSLSGLLAGLEEARSSRPGSRRRTHGGTGGRRTALARRRRGKVAPPGTATGRVNAIRQGTAPRLRGLEDGQQTEQGASRARRMDRRYAAEATSLWRVLRRRLTGVPEPRAVAAGSDAAGIWSSSHPAPTRSFQEAFWDAELEDGVRRRLRTSNGRLRMQTEEELFATHPARSGSATA